jgi:hypothetical protein
LAADSRGHGSGEREDWRGNTGKFFAATGKNREIIDGSDRGAQRLVRSNVAHFSNCHIDMQVAIC